LASIGVVPVHQDRRRPAEPDRLGLVQCGHLDVLDLDAGDPAVFEREVDHFGVGFDPCAVVDGVGGVGHTEPKGVDGAVGNTNRPLDPLGEMRLLSAGLFTRNNLGRYIALRTAPELFFEVLVGVAFQLDKEATGVFDTVAGNPVEDAVFFHTVDRAFLVGDRVATPAVEVAMGATGGPLGEVPPLDEGDVEPPHGEVTGGARAGRSAADNDD